MRNDLKKNSKVLIISWSPIPTPKYQKIEGSGQRFFGLATGLIKNGIKDITIAVGTIYPLDVNEVSGIKLFNYDFDETFIKKIAEYDTIIFNYTIHGSAFIAQHLPATAQVIVDAYGPAYIENLARDPKDLVGTYIGNLSAVKEVFNQVLLRGDYFLYANDAQEKLYTGVLATLGIINQFSYHTKRLLCVPFGIDKPDPSDKFSNPYSKYGVKDDDFVLLWFGGLYPWFDITDILDTIKNNKSKKLKFVIVGGNNPQNQHPDFIKHYHDTLKYIEKNGLSAQTIIIDWADFATRRKYYEHANAIISMNRASKENVYSWRTRVMDYLGSTTPLITNGGDPLSDELVQVGAAFKIEDNDPNSITKIINDLVNNKQKLSLASAKMQELQPKYYWQTVTSELAEIVKAQTKPLDEEKKFRDRNAISDSIKIEESTSTANRRSVKSISRLVLRKVKNDGVRVTGKIIKDKVSRRVTFEYRKKFPVITKIDPKIVIVSNQLNNTGAPFVILDLVKQMKAKAPSLMRSIRFIAFTPIESANITTLKKNGINAEVYTNRELSLDLNQGDVVVFNTFAMSKTTATTALNAAEQGIVKKIYWYGHESSPEGFIDPEIKRRFVALLKSDRAKLYSVSGATLREYQKFFGTSQNVEKMTFPFRFPNEKFKVCKSADFNELRFISTGSMMDMRKGQYPILFAFLDFYHNNFKKSPELYRNFHIDFIGAYEKSDLGPEAAYHVRNILRQFKMSAAGLEEHFSMSPGLSHTKALQRIEAANVTICYSLFEALGIFVYEGMAVGHPIIRNESAGQAEQLVNGENGYGVSSDDFAGLVSVIEEMLNKDKTSNEKLVKMSKLSSLIAKRATTQDFFIIEDIVQVFKP